MKRTTARRLPLLFVAFVALLALAPAASAQARGDARAALTTFPDAQAVLYVNLDRLVNEALPRVMPPAEYQKMLAEPQKVGLDIRGLRHAVLGVRFAEGSQSPIPEFVLLLHGDFNADTLLMAGRVGISAMKLESREETYGGKTISLLNVEKLMKGGGGEQQQADGQQQPEGGGSKPNPFPFPELAVTAYDSNTIVAGVPAYVRSTVDAMGGGQGRLRPSILDLAAKDPQALWSLAAELPPGLPQMLQKTGMPSNAEVERIIGWLKGVSLSQGMDALNFTMRAAVMTDSPEHASAISGLIQMGATAATVALTQNMGKNPGPAAQQNRMALNALKTFTNRVEGGTVLLGISVPQRVLAEVVKKEMTKKPAAATKAPRRRRGTRRR
ncbi:MAG TPA: hypothetical protein VD968_11375 [Pyrinomonadaceae bacterium]|nr:hypothetical protein [Pyrinomonadaceae bacterium]